NGIQDFHLVDRIVCYGEMLTDFVPTVGRVSLAEALAFRKAAGDVPEDIVVGISRLEAFCKDGGKRRRSKGECDFMLFRNPSTDLLLCKSELDVDLMKKVKLT
ncbi:hypothetical protein GIB67_005630, partial [Kingdonia uniflora]